MNLNVESAFAEGGQLASASMLAILAAKMGMRREVTEQINNGTVPWEAVSDFVNRWNRTHGREWREAQQKERDNNWRGLLDDQRQRVKELEEKIRADAAKVSADDALACATRVAKCVVEKLGLQRATGLGPWMAAVVASRVDERTPVFDWWVDVSENHLLREMHAYVKAWVQAGAPGENAASLLQLSKRLEALIGAQRGNSKALLDTSVEGLMEMYGGAWRRKEWTEWADGGGISAVTTSTFRYTAAELKDPHPRFREERLLKMVLDVISAHAPSSALLAEPPAGNLVVPAPCAARPWERLQLTKLYATIRTVPWDDRAPRVLAGAVPTNFLVDCPELRNGSTLVWMLFYGDDGWSRPMLFTSVPRAALQNEAVVKVLCRTLAYMLGKHKTDDAPAPFITTLAESPLLFLARLGCAHQDSVIAFLQRLLAQEPSAVNASSPTVAVIDEPMNSLP